MTSGRALRGGRCLFGDIRARQVARALLEDEDARRWLRRVADLNAGVAGVARRGEAISLARRNSRSALDRAGVQLFTTPVEAAGVFVLLIGNLGSHHSAIDVEAFRASPS